MALTVTVPVQTPDEKVTEEGVIGTEPLWPKPVSKTVPLYPVIGLLRVS